MRARLEQLREDGVITDLDLHFALSMSRIADEADPDVMLAAAMASRQVGQGHVCLDLGRLAGGKLSFDVADGAEQPAWPAFRPWIDKLDASRLVRKAESPGPARPLVLDSAGRLFLERYHTEGTGVARLSGFPDRSGTIALYEELAGAQTENLEYYEVLAGMRFSVILIRLAQQMIARGFLPADTEFEWNNPVSNLHAKQLVEHGIG